MGKILIVALALLALAGTGSQGAQEPGVVLGPFDVILDTYVRDGYVYYRALKLERRRLDEYVRQLGASDVDKRTRAEQMAFWLNAYDALVLQTVIDGYERVLNELAGSPPIPTQKAAERI